MKKMGHAVTHTSQRWREVSAGVCVISIFVFFLPIPYSLALRVPFSLFVLVTDRDIHEAYDFTGPVLGKGSFATVLRVRDRMSGSEYAVKQARRSLSESQFSRETMIDFDCLIGCRTFN